MITIKEVKFADYNGQDNLYFEIAENISKIMKEEQPLYSAEKEFEDGKFIVNIWKCGIAKFGFLQTCDPIHGNAPYMWSSNACAINDAFSLYNTPLELARYGAGLRYPNDVGYVGSYWAAELTKELAEKIGRENEELLNYGLDAWLQTIDCRQPYFNGRDSRK